ncbi:MAG: exosortase/archaeosortase family protein [Planctomycetota bacterium]
MTTAQTTNLDAAGQRTLSPTDRSHLAAWALAGLLGVLFCLFFWNFLRRSALFAWADMADWGHIVIIPAISAVLLWQRWERLKALPIRPSWLGLVPLIAGVASYAFWVHPGRNDMFQGYSMVIALFGLVWLICGTRSMSILSIPVLFLFLGVKVADRIWSALALYLQHIAADLSTRALQMLSFVIPGFYDANKNGSVIVLEFYKNGTIVSESLNVAEACAGLRSLMIYIVLGSSFAFLMQLSWWRRLVLIGSTVPVAIFINCCRVTSLGLLYQIHPDYASGDFHTMIGMLWLGPAFGLFMLIWWIMDRIVIVDKSAASKRLIPVDRPDSFTHEPASRPSVASVVWACLSGVLVAAAAALAYRYALPMPKPEFVIPGIPTALNETLQAMVVIVALPLITGVAAAALLLGAVPRLLPALAVPAHAQGVTAKAQRIVTVAFAAALLGSMATAQFTTLATLDARLVKLPVPLRHHLFMLPNQVGAWEMVRDEPALSKDIIDELGTEDYLTRIYADTQAEPNAPGAFVSLHMAYYTGTPDTVPHVPERCFVGGGFLAVASPDVVPVALDSPMYFTETLDDGTSRVVAPSALAKQEVTLPAKNFDVTLFQWQGGPEEPVSTVIYFFIANNRALATPDAVRAHGFSIQEKYSYYHKVEMRWHRVADPDEAVRLTENFLADALPEIMACLPDWQDVREGKWPQPDQP